MGNFFKHLNKYISSNNPLLEYVLLIGDVNGAYEIKPFTIPSFFKEW